MNWEKCRNNPRLITKLKKLKTYQQFYSKY